MKLRDASNVLRSVAAIHMRDAANVLRAVPTIHMRDAANALKTAYSSGPPPAVTFTPPSIFTSSDSDFANASSFTASFGGAASSIVWSVESLDGCTASVIDGQGTATALIRIVVNDTGADDIITGSCVVRCTATVGGSSRTGTAGKSHSFIYNSGPRH